MKYAMFLILTAVEAKDPILSEKLFVYVDKQACEEKLVEIPSDVILRKRVGKAFPLLSFGASYVCVPYPNG